MAIPAVNLSVLPSGAAALGAGGVQVMPPVVVEPAAVGTATFVGDGATTSAVLNFIDGTASLPFTPSAVLAFASGGTAAATISAVSVSAITAISATVTFSAAPANAATIKILFMLFR